MSINELVVQTKENKNHFNVLLVKITPFLHKLAHSANNKWNIYSYEYEDYFSEALIVLYKVIKKTNVDKLNNEKSFFSLLRTSYNNHLVDKFRVIVAANDNKFIEPVIFKYIKKSVYRDKRKKKMVVNTYNLKNVQIPYDDEIEYIKDTENREE